jgi:propionyl-CoA synthetase
VKAVIGMLAVARIGATHSVVFGGFAAKELAARISHAQPKVILSANCGLEPTRVVLYKPILDEALQMSSVDGLKCLIYNREDYPTPDLKVGRDIDWNDALASVERGHDPVPVPSSHPLYILYTSGTTGKLSLKS